MKYESRKDKNYIQHIVYDDGTLTAISLSAHTVSKERDDFSLSVTMMTLNTVPNSSQQAVIKEVFTLNDWSRGDDPEDLIMDFMTLYETFEVFPHTKIVDEYTVFDHDGKPMIEGMSISNLCRSSGHSSGHKIDPLFGDRYLRRIPKEKTPNLVK